MFRNCIKFAWKSAAFLARIICAVDGILNDFSDTFLTDPPDKKTGADAKQKPFHKIIFEKVRNFLEI